MGSTKKMKVNYKRDNTVSNISRGEEQKISSFTIKLYVYV